MIKDTIKIHDRFTFELKLEFPAEEGVNTTEYNVNSWMFIPASLEINKVTFPKESFFNNLKNLIRFTTPVCLLRDMTVGENSPIKKLENAAFRFSSTPDAENRVKYIQRLKLFASVFAKSMQDSIDLAKKIKPTEDQYHLFEAILKETKLTLESYRSVIPKLRVPTIKKKDFNRFLLTDEYISLFTEYKLLRMGEFLERTGKLGAAKSELLEKIYSFARNEMDYRSGQGYIAVIDPESDNEAFLHRISMLKKYAGSTLFLNVQTSRDGQLAEQLLFSLAAGFSMVFATAIAFWSQSKYGNFTMPFFIALVLSYMAKDRIKEIARVYMSGQLNKLFYDFRTLITNSDGYELGFIKESMSYPEFNKLPEEIQSARRRTINTDVDYEPKDEKIISYRKRIHIYSKKLRRSERAKDFAGITDVMRFNLTSFTRMMDDPERDLLYPTGNGVHYVKGHRVYHLNLLINYISPTGTNFKRFRIVMNRQGIVRIDRIKIKL